MGKQEHFTAFNVKKHGFQFGNTFNAEKIMDEMKIGYAIPNRGTPEYEIYKTMGAGLCSGMCWAALDRYFGKIKRPDTTESPQSGKLFKELVHRNWDAMKWGWTIGKVIAYQACFDDGKLKLDKYTLGYKTQINEWPKIKEKLKKGIPATMVLITQSQLALLNPLSLTKNHAVVAIGYKYDSDTKRVKIYAYDPNHRRNRIKISFTLGAEYYRLSIKHDEGDTLRGFFYNSYDRKERLITEKDVKEMDQELIDDLSWFWLLFGSN